MSVVDDLHAHIYAHSNIDTGAPWAAVHGAEHRSHFYTNIHKLICFLYWSYAYTYAPCMHTRMHMRIRAYTRTRIRAYTHTRIRLHTCTRTSAGKGSLRLPAQVGQLKNFSFMGQ